MPHTFQLKDKVSGLALYRQNYVLATLLSSKMLAIFDLTKNAIVNQLKLPGCSS
jgi:hypothetical protein